MLNTIEYLKRCQEVTMQYINSQAPLKERAEVASRVLIKSMPSDIRLDANVNSIIAMGKVLVDNTPLEINVGTTPTLIE
jgi:hypothetical protein